MANGADSCLMTSLRSGHSEPQKLKRTIQKRFEQDQAHAGRHIEEQEARPSRMENCDGEPVRTNSKNLQAVLHALSRAGVEIEDDGLRLLKRRR